MNQPELNFTTAPTKLKLTKPIAFFDLETTGVNVGVDRIVEISILKLDSNGERDVKTMRINPMMPIPAESSAIHGIYDKDVQDKPTFEQVAHELNKYLAHCDLAGYNNIRFDVPLLVEEFLRADIDFDFTSRRLVDVQNIFHKMEKRTLEAAYKFYCDKTLENAHSAEADILATWEVLEAQLEKYEVLEPNVEFLHDFCNINDNADLAGRIVFDKNKTEVFNFGKYKGRPVADIFNRVDPSYYKWMMDGDFPRSTKKIITAIKLSGLNTAKK